MGRCLSPCLGDLDPNLYRRRLDEALRLFLGDGARRLLGHVEAQMRAASAAQQYERAAWLRRRLRRLGVIVERVGGVLEATHARPRLVVCAHPVDASRRDAFWIVGGRLVDWGPLEDGLGEGHERTVAALRRGGRLGELGAHVPPDEVDEVRIVATYLASHPWLPQLALEPAPTVESLKEWLQRDVDDLSAGMRRLDRPGQENGTSTSSAATPSPTATGEPAGASLLTSASAIQPSLGD
jgi:DNA polymerase-3 subunit epsilon